MTTLAAADGARRSASRSWLGPAPGAAQPAKDNCAACHLETGDERLMAPAKAFDGDIHKAKGFGCVACHGGDAARGGHGGDEPRQGVHRQAPARADPAALRPLPLRRAVHEALQSRAPRRPGRRVRDLRPRAPAARARRSQGRGLRELPPRAFHPAAVGPEVERPSAARRRHVRALSRRRQVHGRLQDPDRPAREVQDERSLEGDDGQGRPVRADVQRLPRQPRRLAAGDHLGGQRLRAVPLRDGRPLQEERPRQGLRRDGLAGLRDLPREPRDQGRRATRCSASATRPCARPATRPDDKGGKSAIRDARAHRFARRRDRQGRTWSSTRPSTRAWR